HDADREPGRRADRRRPDRRGLARVRAQRGGAAPVRPPRLPPRRRRRRGRAGRGRGRPPRPLPRGRAAAHRRGRLRQLGGAVGEVLRRRGRRHRPHHRGVGEGRVTAAALDGAGLATSARRPRHPGGLTPASGLGLGVALVWFSLLVLLPLAAVAATTAEGGWGGFWRAVTNEQTAAAIRLTVTQALLVTAVDVVMGTLVAWVLVRDSFPGKRLLELLIDIPFALPRIVAGLVLLSLYGPDGPLGVDVTSRRPAVFLALLFVTTPFVVRTVQPVLAELDPEAEEAAASLGAGRLTIFRRIVLPAITPAIAAGAALAFARGMGEYGSLVLLSGNLPFRTEVASVRILASIESDDLPAAASVATVLLVVSLAVIAAIDLLQRRMVRRG